MNKTVDLFLCVCLSFFRITKLANTGIFLLLSQWQPGTLHRGARELSRCNPPMAVTSAVHPECVSVGALQTSLERGGRLLGMSKGHGEQCCTRLLLPSPAPQPKCGGSPGALHWRGSGQGQGIHPDWAQRDWLCWWHETPAVIVRDLPPERLWVGKSGTAVPSR